MREMFEEAKIFNKNLEDWDVSKVADMSRMFQGASVYNQDMSVWNTNKVTECNDFTNQATAFDRVNVPQKGCFSDVLFWEFDYLDTSKFATIKDKKISIELPTTEFTAKLPILPDGATITPDVTTITDWSDEIRFTLVSGAVSAEYILKVTVVGKDIVYVNDLNFKGI